MRRLISKWFHHTKRVCNTRLFNMISLFNSSRSISLSLRLCLFFIRYFYFSCCRCFCAFVFQLIPFYCCLLFVSFHPSDVLNIKREHQHKNERCNCVHNHVQCCWLKYGTRFVLISNQKKTPNHEIPQNLITLSISIQKYGAFFSLLCVFLLVFVKTYFPCIVFDTLYQVTVQLH